MKQLSYTSLTPTEDGNSFVDNNGKIWQPLNSKQKLFCKEYFKGQTATDAAVKAGYTKDRKGAKTQGSVLLNHNPVVRNYLIDLEIAASERDAVSLETHLSTLHDLREEAKDQGQISAAITAEVHRGKAGGLYIDRREILTAKSISCPRMIYSIDSRTLLRKELWMQRLLREKYPRIKTRANRHARVIFDSLYCFTSTTIGYIIVVS